MNEIYKTLAEGYEKLAAGYRALAKDQKDKKVEMAVPAEPKKKEISIEEAGWKAPGSERTAFEI